MSLSKEIEKLQEKLFAISDDPAACSHVPNVACAYSSCAAKLTPLLELAKEMERALDELEAKWIKMAGHRLRRI